MPPMVAVAVAFLLVVLGTPYVAYIGYYTLARPDTSLSKDYEWEPNVSVVLPTYNEESIIDEKLDDIYMIDYPMGKVEVVVVDASDDSTAERIRSWFDSQDSTVPSLNIIEEDGRNGLAVALNMGYRAASHEVIVKTDCDSKIAPNAIREAVATLAADGIGAVTGRNAEVLGGSAVEEGYRGIQSVIQKLETALDSTFIFHGPFSAFKRDYVRPVDVDSLADDSELALHIRRQNQRVVFDDSVRFKEAAHSEFTKRRQQKDRRAMGLLRLLWRQKDALGRYGNYGRVVLSFNWWFMIVSPILTHLTIVAALGAAYVLFGIGGVVTTGVAFVAFVFLGQRDWLGPTQPMYSLYDTQVSLLHAMWKLLVEGGDGTWEIDGDLRQHY